MVDIFLTFLRLGATSFGGPVAHLAVFREELVHRRGWLTQMLRLMGVEIALILGLALLMHRLSIPVWAWVLMVLLVGGLL